MTVIVTADKQSEDLFSFLILRSQAGNIYAHITADQLTIFPEGDLLLTVSWHFLPQHKHGL